MKNCYKNYYSIIQYCPCRSRKEVVNIGIVVFNSLLNKTIVKISNNNNMVSKFFGEDSFDDEWLSLAKEMTKNTIEKVSDSMSLKKIIETRANEIILTELVQIPDIECNIDNLFKELVDR